MLESDAAAAAAAAAAATAGAAAVQQAVEESPRSLSSMPYGDRYKAARQEVPPFEGKHTYTVEAFLVKLATAFLVYNIAQTDYVAFAFSRLEGEATKFQVELQSEYPAGAPSALTYNELKARLESRFPVPTEESAEYSLPYWSRREPCVFAVTSRALSSSYVSTKGAPEGYSL